MKLFDDAAGVEQTVERSKSFVPLNAQQLPVPVVLAIAGAFWRIGRAEEVTEPTIMTKKAAAIVCKPLRSRQVARYSPYLYFVQLVVLYIVEDLAAAESLMEAQWT